MSDEILPDITYTLELVSHLLAVSETSSRHYGPSPADSEGSTLKEKN